MTTNNQTKLLYAGLLAILISGPGCTRQSPARPSSTDNSPSADSTIERVCKITAIRMDVNASSVTATTSLNELGADELDFVEIVLEIEDEFDIAIPDEVIEGITGTDIFDGSIKKVTMGELAGIVDDQKR